MSKVKQVAKQAASSRTNRTVAMMVIGAVSVMIAKRLGLDIAKELAAFGLDIEDVMGLATAAAGALVVWYRERGRVKDAGR